jgi:predicted dehydrogenase
VLRVAIVGCGRIADSHASQIRRIKEAEIVGVCDREELMAKQFCQRFRVKRYFTEVGDLLEGVHADVVHITTPPQSHFEIAMQCLEQGCHAYVEKPFTLTTREAEELIECARGKSLKLTAGHDDQFRHAARRLRSLVQSGYLGGAPVHMESHYGYEIGSGGYTQGLLGDKDHWVRRLPGQLLQNIISHGIARIAEFLPSDSVQVLAHGFVSSALGRMGEDEIVDELRVMMSDVVHGTTAYFTFSSQMRPSLHQFRIYGPRNGLQLDQDTETLVRLPGTRYKSYGEQFLSPVLLGGQYIANASRNVRSFLANDFHAKSGMKYLIESFYRSITEDTPLPIPYREILVTSRIMDSIFEQLRASSGRRSEVAVASSTMGDAVYATERAIGLPSRELR